MGGKIVFQVRSEAFPVAVGFPQFRIWNRAERVIFFQENVFQSALNNEMNYLAYKY